MPKNTKKMKNAKNVTVSSREFNLKEENQEYAFIVKPLGDNKMQCRMPDGTDKLGIIRKSLRRKKSKNMIHPNDIVLVSLRDFQENKVDIIAVYNEMEVKKLLKLKEISHHFVTQSEETDRPFDFAYDDDDEDDDDGDDFDLEEL